MVENKSLISAKWLIGLLIVVPFGIALQNLFVFLLMITLLSNLSKNWSAAFPRIKNLVKKHRALICSSLSVILATLIGGALNNNNPDTDLVGFAGGFLPWVVMPVLIGSMVRFNESDLGRIKVVFAWVSAAWAVICLSQHLWGWRLDESNVVFGFHRAYALYSHPLTLAYVVALLWPASFVFFVNHITDRLYQVIFISLTVVLWASESRGVMAVSGLFATAYGLFQLRGKVRLGLIVAMVATILATFSTENRFSRMFGEMIDGTGYKSAESYAFDRLSFWHAFSGIIADKPLIGHGPDLNTEYRHPYYERIGLGDVDNQYEAHNTFIQLFAEAGVVGFCALLVYIYALYGLGFHCQNVVFRHAVYATLLVFWPASLLQNSIQDGEVRFALWVLLSLWLVRAESDQGVVTQES